MQDIKDKKKKFVLHTFLFSALFMIYGRPHFQILIVPWVAGVERGREGNFDFSCGGALNYTYNTTAIIHHKHWRLQCQKVRTRE